MKAVNFSYNGEWDFKEEHLNATLIMCFGHKDLINKTNIKIIQDKFPNASIVSASTSGEIIGTEVYDNTITGTAISFDNTEINIHCENTENHKDSFELGKALSSSFEKKDLKHVFVLSDGHLINGSRLLEGLTDVLPHIIISGGLAGDGSNFESTLVGIDRNIKQGNVVAIGYYGDHIQIGHASLGGWDEFGPERYITKSKENVLLELDDEPALDLYKKFLGDKASELPSSALLFPLSLRENEDSTDSVVRTVLSIDEENKSMTFAGNLPEDGLVRLMKANFDKLIVASSDAAEISIKNLKNNKVDLAVYVSCVGRKLILGPRTSEEVQSAQKIIGEDVPSLGFYSYGEISPMNDSVKCSLHNQTMTITTYNEI
jgi:hypothetical protein